MGHKLKFSKMHQICVFIGDIEDCTSPRTHCTFAATDLHLSKDILPTFAVLNLGAILAHIHSVWAR